MTVVKECEIRALYGSDLYNEVPRTQSKGQSEMVFRKWRGPQDFIERGVGYNWACKNLGLLASKSVGLMPDNLSLSQEVDYGEED